MGPALGLGGYFPSPERSFDSRVLLTTGFEATGWFVIVPFGAQADVGLLMGPSDVGPVMTQASVYLGFWILAVGPEVSVVFDETTVPALGGIAYVPIPQWNAFLPGLYFRFGYPYIEGEFASAPDYQVGVRVLFDLFPDGSD